MLHFTPCSKCSQQNLLEEETAFKMTFGPERPVTATNQEMIVRNWDLVMADPWLLLLLVTSIQHIPTTPGISHPNILHILTKVLAMRKMSVRLVPRRNWLTPKRHPIQHLSWLFALFSSQIHRTFWRDLWLVFPLALLWLIVAWASANWMTGFTTLVWNKSRLKESRQWKHSYSPSPKKAKVVHSAGKVIASDFWDADGIYWWLFIKRILQLLEDTVQPCCGSSSAVSKPSPGES